MILPIFAYGHPVLNKETRDIDDSYPNLEKLIDDMWETMYNARGMGLAAPQVGLDIRLFLVDTEQMRDPEDENSPKGIKKVFINATILEEEGQPQKFEEGCLSIPNIRGDVSRRPKLTIEYQDEAFKWHTETFEDLEARVIQHEYDHVDGILFTEHLSPLKRRLMKRKLQKIRSGNITPDYRMRFARN